MMEDKLPNNTFAKVNTTKLVCLEYPGFMKNVDKMLATIGGEGNISDTYYNNRCRLPMSYRPEDLNSHVACADLLPCAGLLMKVRRRKKKQQTDGEMNEYEYKQEIVGIIKDQYKFQTLMDFQYLTPEPMWDYFKNIHGSELARQNFAPYFAPPTFSRIDSCGLYNYRPDPLSARQTHVGRDIVDTLQSNTSENSAVVRKRRQTESMAALYENESIPQTPSNVATTIIENLMKTTDGDKVNVARKLFTDRPIWSKLGISCNLGIGPEKVKKLLQCLGYYWLSGPWRTMWSRMGYDPRKDPKAKIYQMIDFRFRDSKVVARRSYKNYIPRNLQSRVLPLGSSVMAASEEPVEKDHIDLHPYIFRPNKMLPSRNTMYQLCDILDPKVQKIIHENDGQETECNEKEGWFPTGTMNRIRAQMTITVNEYFNRENVKKKYLVSEEVNMECSSVIDNDESMDTGFQPFSYLQMLQGDEDEEEVEGYQYEEYDYYNIEN